MVEGVTTDLITVGGDRLHVRGAEVVLHAQPSAVDVERTVQPVAGDDLGRVILANRAVVEGQHHRGGLGRHGRRRRRCRDGHSGGRRRGGAGGGRGFSPFFGGARGGGAVLAGGGGPG